MQPITVLKYLKQIPTELKGESDKCTITAAGVNDPSQHLVERAERKSGKTGET